MTGLDLTVDPARVASGLQGETGIYVRALNGAKWDSWDIACLDRRSLLTWLRSRGDAPRTYAEAVVLALLGHPSIPEVPEGDL